MERSSVITIMLSALCFVLGWLVYEQAQPPTSMTIAHDPSSSTGATVNAGKTGLKEPTIVFPPIDEFQEITARPLFNASRRPIVVDKPKPILEKPELHIMLSGIVIDRTQQIAHLRSNDDKRVQTLGVGDRIGDWRIVSIEADRVILRSGGHVETLFMQKYGSREAAKHQTNQQPGKRSVSKRRNSADRSKQQLRDRLRQLNRQRLQRAPK